MAAFGWGDEAQTSDSSFTLLEPGEYDFHVVKFERGRHPGSAKLGPCDKAIYTLHVKAPDGRATDVKENLFLDDSCAWKITQFFKCVGLIPADTKPGTSVRFPWDETMGKTGRLRLGVRAWTGDDGQERQSNQVEEFVRPEAAGGGYGTL